MLSSMNKDNSPSKCYVSHGDLPNMFDSKQPPTKKRPFVTMLDQPFNHKVLCCCRTNRPVQAQLIELGSRSNWSCPKSYSKSFGQSSKKKLPTLNMFEWSCRSLHCSRMNSSIRISRKVNKSSVLELVPCQHIAIISCSFMLEFISLMSSFKNRNHYHWLVIHEILFATGCVWLAIYAISVPWNSRYNCHILDQIYTFISLAYQGIIANYLPFSKFHVYHHHIIASACSFTYCCRQSLGLSIYYLT